MAKREAARSKWSGWLMLPKKIDQHYIWPDLEVKKHPDEPYKGEGVFAKRDLQRFTFIPYLGVIFPQFMFPKSFLDEVVSVESQYVQQSRWRDQNVLIDGSPRFLPWNNIGCRGLAISAKINEPSEHVMPNCVFLDEKSVGLPFWGSLFVVTTRDIKAQEELTVCFGPEFPRDYKTVQPLCRQTQKFDKKSPLYGELANFVDKEKATLYQFPRIVSRLWQDSPPGEHKKRELIEIE